MNISLERDAPLVMLVTDFIPLSFSNFNVLLSIVIVTRLQTGRSGDRYPAEARMFPFFKSPLTAPGLTQAPTKSSFPASKSAGALSWPLTSI